MPSYDLYKKLNTSNHACGNPHFKESRDIFEATFWDDPHATIGYFYNWYQDTNHSINDSLSDPKLDENKTPIDIKFIVTSSQTYEKDNITYHIQFKPSQTVPDSTLYKELFQNVYGSKFPIGEYVDIQDCDGNWNRWLVVAGANENDPQFPTYEVLRCNYIIQYVYDDVKYNIPSVLRSQNSYNSGIWSDRTYTTVENQQKFVCPINRETEKIFYNQRMIIDNAVLTEPLAWQVTKVNRVSTKGVVVVTLAQDHFNSSTDLIEKDSDGMVIGMWANYYNSSVTPSEFNPTTPSSIHAVINYAGKDAVIKVGGGYKNFTISFFDGEEEIPFEEGGTWEYTINDEDASELIDVVFSNEYTFKIKFLAGREYLGKMLNIKYTSPTEVVADINVGIKSL